MLKHQSVCCPFQTAMILSLIYRMLASTMNTNNDSNIVKKYIGETSWTADDINRTKATSIYECEPYKEQNNGEKLRHKRVRKQVNKWLQARDVLECLLKLIELISAALFFNATMVSFIVLTKSRLSNRPTAYTTQPIATRRAPIIEAAWRTTLMINQSS